MKIMFNRIAAVILLLISIWFIGFNAIRYFSKPYKTEIVVPHTAVDTVNVKGTAFRDEKIIEHHYNGVLRYLYNDASMVKKGTAVMEVYPSVSDISNIEKIIKLTNEEKEYQKLSNIKFSTIVSTDLLTKEIDKKVYDFLALCDSRKMISSQEKKVELTMMMNKKDIYTGSKANYNQKAQIIRDEISQLKSSTSEPIDLIEVDSSGYFVKFTDGYENICTTSLIGELEPEKFKEIVAKKPNKLSNDVVGKIINDHNWYFVFSVSKENMDKFRTSPKVDVNFHLSQVSSVPANVVGITQSQDKQSYLIILKINYISDEIAAIRTQTAEIGFRFYSGLRINRDAIRFLDNQKGVYVVTPNEIKFVPVDIIYEDKSYVVCKNTGDKNALKIYDKVVVGGNVYDGKPIQ